jgi:dTDP-4-amino-4,6-dideoxygalactose transaminase
MLNGPFSPWPSFTEEEASAVKNVILSNKVNYWTGKECREFEREFAMFSESEYAIAVANGTVALDLAFNALELSEGDEVIVTPRTFIASVSSIVNAGAIPVFADVDPDSQNITAETIKVVITPRTKAIVCVHLAGWPCDLDPIMALAAEHNIYVIEDCAQAHGARYKGKSVGSIGHIGAWSFCQDKIMTTGGEGGMVTTNDRKLWSKMWSFKDHGKSWSAIYEGNQHSGFKWVHETFGTNFRMTEMQAAIGRIQLRKMPEWSKKRQMYAEQIWNAARESGVMHAPDFSNYVSASFVESTVCVHGAYKCYVFVDSVKRDKFISEINARGVPCFMGSCSEVYLEKAFDHFPSKPLKRLPVAQLLGETSLMFLCHPTLTQTEIDLTCSVIKEVCVKLYTK